MRIAGAGFGPLAASYASTFSERLRGLAGAASLPALLIDTSSVHTLGMTAPIGVVGIDGHMRVVASRVVPPNRVVWLRGSRLILEVPDGTRLPDVGTRLRLDPDE